jgi:hypothetical protein
VRTSKGNNDCVTDSLYLLNREALYTVEDKRRTKYNKKLRVETEAKGAKQLKRDKRKINFS